MVDTKDVDTFAVIFIDAGVHVGIVCNVNVCEDTGSGKTGEG